MAQENTFGRVPYAFKSEYTEEVENLPANNKSLSPIIPTLEEWCSCRQFEVMPTAEECMCCKHCDYTIENMGEIGCITDHDQFDLLILNPDVLSITIIQFMMFNKQQGCVTSLDTDHTCELIRTVNGYADITEHLEVFGML